MKKQKPHAIYNRYYHMSDKPAHGGDQRGESELKAQLGYAAFTRLRELSERLGPLYTTDSKYDYGCYYRDDLGNEETLLSGTTDDCTRDAICFLVEAVKEILGHDKPAYMPDRDE